jgi:hypothetical protein
LITFGRSYDTKTLRIIDPATSFKTSSTLIAWSADVTRAGGDPTITMTLAARASGDTERVIYTLDVDLANPGSDTLANKWDLALLVDRRVGTYVLRYLTGKEVLAEGTFRLVK